jgi:hypothetical protein
MRNSVERAPKHIPVIQKKIAPLLVIMLLAVVTIIVAGCT